MRTKRVANPRPKTIRPTLRGIVPLPSMAFGLYLSSNEAASLPGRGVYLTGRWK